VRLTFKAFHDVLKAQGEAIKTLERAVDAKASKQDVAAALQARGAQQGQDMTAQLMVRRCRFTPGSRWVHRAWFQRLKLKYDEPPSTSAFTLNLRHYIMELSGAVAGKADAVDVTAQLDRRAMRTDVHAAFQARPFEVF